VHTLQENFRSFEGEGTVFGAINRDGFLSMKLPMPPAGIVQRFESLVYPLDQMIENNERQSNTLTSIRDGLLPKLISGEIRLRAAEELVGEKV
jgi:type I restriction enzyme S subunit